MRSKPETDEDTSSRTVPLPIQTFLWRQTSSFVRPKLGKLHEASCISMEKVLVQNIQFGLSPSLTEAIRSIPRWKFVQYALPHVMLCTAQLITERRETSNLQNVGTAASKLLYTLHWTILDAAEECADADREAGTISKDPFPYIFSLTCIQEFVYLFAPLRHLLKEAELQNFRLENGLKIWPSFWDYKHPNAPCFTTPVRPRTPQDNAPDILSSDAAAGSQKPFGLTSSTKGSEDRDDVSQNRSSQESNGIRSPNDKEFPETIPEETSSVEEEHVVIFRLASSSDYDIMKESIYQVPIGKPSSSKKPSLAEHGAANSRNSFNYSDSSETVTPNLSLLKVNRQESWTDSANRNDLPHRRSSALKDVTLATFLDIAVVRCLFMQHWSEEGVHWALQFMYYRLQEIGEELQWRCPQRKRSSSLPVPKIEVSSFCTPDLKHPNKEVPANKTETPLPSTDETDNRCDYQFMQGGLNANQSSTRDTPSYDSATPTTKKRPYKMADLKAFVETRLLSRSEKTLEKIGVKRSGSRSSLLIAPDMDDRNSRGTVDSDTTIPPRPLSALAQTRDGEAAMSLLETAPLYKGKSMPSLSRHLGVNETRTVKKKDPKPPRPAPVTNVPATHPVITVTDHNTGSTTRTSKPASQRLSRSHTDSNIVYPHEDLAEASGSAQYVTKDGSLNYRIILQAVHNVCTRAEVCSMRVCETSLSVLELLLDQNILPANVDEETASPPDTAEATKNQQQSNSAVHGLCMDIIARVFQHIGCPHGCGNSHRGPSSDFIRSQGLLLLSRLNRISPRCFKTFLQKTISTRYTLAEVVDFLHALVGFCMDPGFVLSPTIGQKRNSRFGTDPSTSASYPNTGTNFSNPRTIEGKVVTSILKTLVTRLTTSLKYLKSPENVPLYCDIRQLLAYIKDVHGAAFRRVLLSGLLDSVEKPTNSKGNDSSPPDFSTRNRMSSMCTEDNAPSASFYVIDETVEKNNKKFHRKTNGDPDSWNDEGRDRKPSLAHCLLQSTQRLKEKHSLSVIGSRSGKKVSRIASAVNWIRRDRSGNNLAEEEENETPFIATPQSFAKFNQRTPNSQVGVTLQKARNRMKHKLIRIGIGRSSRKHFVSREVTPDPSRRNSLEMDPMAKDVYVTLPLERKIVNTAAIRNGMLRLSFLLEACQPGVIPEAHLIAASLDLPQAPVIARAAFLLECAHFVHRCNRGLWPSWMKLNLPFFRPSGPLSNRGTPSGQRRTHILQRIAGCMFFSWAEAIGVRLEEMLIEDAMCGDDIFPHNADEPLRHRALQDEDDNEDFLVDASVNPSGKDCPWALRLAACVLLSEITAFLRDSFRRLPRLSRVSLRSTNEKAGCNTGSLNVGNVSSAGISEPSPPHLNNPSTSAIPTSASVNAGRRWSMALSSMGHSQASAQSLQSITGEGHPNGAQGERKISFVLHEPDDESLGSSNTTLTCQGEDNEEKRSRRLTQGRPFLLRRSTMGNAGGSFKRRSLRLGRSQRERKDPDAESIKRSGSVRSQRKVSSISDRSDNSDLHLEHDISGEESPGILSDDQPPESPSDIAEPEECISTRGMPWMRAVLLLSNSFDYQCNHQNVCHPRCYRRQMRACSRLLLAVRRVYDDDPQLDGVELFGFTKKFRTHTVEEKKEKIRLPLSRPGSPNRIRRESIAKRDCSFHSSMAALPRDHTEFDADRNHKAHSAFGSDGKHSKDEEDPSAKKKEEHPIVKYVKSQVIDLFQAPLLVIAKSATILNDEAFLDVLPMAWELLLDSHKETAAAAAAVFILAAVRCPEPCMALVNGAFRHQDPTERINALLRFQVLWRSRHQVWARMEEGAAHNFKVPPHSIEFTLPSPRIGVESSPVVDPPWMPHVKAQVQEVTLNQDTHRSLVTATKTRKKQQTELIQAALKAEEDRKRTEREDFLITTVPVTIQASYEPALHHTAGDDHDDDEETEQPRSASQPLQHAQALFPSCLSAAIVPIVQLLDDSTLNADGVAVSQVASQVVHSCLVEDTALFLRYILEKLTRERQEEMFGILRRLLCYVPHLPQQTAYTLHNYLIGFVMFYVRSPQEGGQELIGSALSLLAVAAPSVPGLLFKDLKQTLRKEQCDASILITANVPSAKKIVVHGPQGPDSGGIPSQFPVQEDTQFTQILQESLDFFGIDENKHKEYFLVDYRTSQIHNPSAYVRDYYFFKRSQYPQLTLVRMEPNQAYDALQKQAFVEKLVEVGKVLFVTSILKNYGQIIARVLFIHEELMKLPSFPRKALEADLNLYNNGCMGKKLRGLDFLHKLSWVRLVARMFEVMAGNFAYSGDIHLFINVVNGAFVLHCEDSALTRLCMATFINAAHQFRNVFALNGYSLIIPTLLRTYSNYQSNPLVTKSIEFTIQQFYIMHRKPFLLQLFGSVAPLLDCDEDSMYGDASKVRVKAFFKLLLSLERLSADPLHILDLVLVEKPLKALDFCYHGESDTVSVMDCIALAVMGASYATDTPRGHQLLTILEATIPAHLKHLQSSSGKKDVRAERDILHQISVAMKTLIINAEALAKNYTGPQPPVEKTSSQRNCATKPGATAIEIDEDSHSKFLRDHFRGPAAYERDLEDDSELRWQEFRLPRTALLSLVSDFIGLSSTRLAELNKKLGQDTKSTELLDIKCHLRLADIAHSLLKVSSYDPATMACRGLQAYMINIMPNIDWSLEQMRPALTMIFRRLDKIFGKICKVPSIRKNVDWEAAAGLLQGVYSTLRKCPYVVHVQHLRSLISICQALILGEYSGNLYEGSPGKGAGGRYTPSITPPVSFCSTAVRLIAMQILALGLFSHISLEGYSLEQACGGNSVFPTTERAEAVLINLILPLCLQAGLGKKEAPRMRQSDVSFALTVVLHALSPPPLRPHGASSTGPKLSVMDARSGSFSVHSSSENRNAQRGRNSLYQVAFLGLKILTTCFSPQLCVDWPRVARCIREIADRKEGGGALWNFLVFVTVQRGPLFTMLLPLIRKKTGLPVECDDDQLYQDLLQQSMNGLDSITPHPVGEMIQQFQAELQLLKEDFYSRKEEDDIDADGKHSIVPDAHSDVSNASAMSRRPTVDTASSQRENSRDPVMLHPPRGSSVPNTGFVSGLTNLRRQWSVRSENRQLLPPPGRQISLQARVGYTRRTSYAGEATSRAGLPQGTACSAASDTRLNRRSLGPSSSSVSRTSSISETEFCEQDENALAETEGGATSPAGEAETVETTYTFHPRLQRQRLQSKGKTFRFKKSMANIEVSHIEVEQELVSLPSIKTPAPDQSLQRLLVPAGGPRVSPNRRGTHSPMMAESRLSSMGSFGEANVTTLTVPKAQDSVEANRIAKATNPLVTVGLAVQVSAASYVPARPTQRTTKMTPAAQFGSRSFGQELRVAAPPPPVPPRGNRLSVSPQPNAGASSNSPPAATSPFKLRPQQGETSSHHGYIPSLLGSIGSHVPRTCLYREWEKEREPPLLEESDSMDLKAGDFGGSSLSVNMNSDSESRSGSVLPCILSTAGSSIESLAMGEEVALLPHSVTEGRQLSFEMRDEDTLI